jgi:hypothetical protein
MPNVRSRSIPWAAVLTLVLSTAARAQWSSDPAVNLPICTDPHPQLGVSIASDDSGGAILAWQDNRNGGYEIYAQRVNAAGVPKWMVNGIPIGGVASNQQVPAIVSDGVGGAVIAWQDRRSGNYDIYAQRVSAAGITQWSPNGVALCAAAADQQYPMITSDGAGGAIVTWQDNRNGNPDIYAQRVTTTGVPQWTTDGVALCTAPDYQAFPVLVTDGSGGAIVTWEDHRGGTTSDIYAQRVNAAGAPQWASDGVAICAAANTQDSPTIAPDGAGGAIVTWEDLRSGTSFDIYAQRVNAAGVAQWTGDGVLLSAAANDQDTPTIVSDGAGSAIVTWQDYRSGTNFDIYAQGVNAAGVPQWTGDGVALSTAASDQVSPTIAPDGAGGAIVTWQDSRSANVDIYAQRVSAAGTAQWTTNGVALCTAPNDQVGPVIVADGTGSDRRLARSAQRHFQRRYLRAECPL